MPADPDRDGNFDAVRELLFRDHDVLLLFDAHSTGSSHPTGTSMSTALFVNLHHEHGSCRSQSKATLTPLRVGQQCLSGDADHGPQRAPDLSQLDGQPLGLQLQLGQPSLHGLVDFLWDVLLVPATMELLGDRNWWLPRWLDRVLPDIEVEGHSGPAPEDEELADEALQPVGR